MDQFLQLYIMAAYFAVRLHCEVYHYEPQIKWHENINQGVICDHFRWKLCASSIVFQRRLAGLNGVIRS
jgi:hypothetical protein